MGTAARRQKLLLIPAATLMLAIVPARSGTPAEGIEGRYVCPLRQPIQPGTDTEIFTLSGPLAEDFRLIDVYGGGLISLLEAARSDFTFLYFLDTSSPESLHCLKVLQALRDRGLGRIGLTAVFLDSKGEESIRRYLSEHSLSPDFALHDPRRSLVRCYGFESPSALNVIGPQGRIIFTASESSPVDLAAFTTDLGRLLNRECPYSSFAEARGIYDDAFGWIRRQSPGMAVLYLERVLELQPQLFTVNRALADVYAQLDEPVQAARHYGRYLAAGPAYDTEEIRRNLRELTAR